mgnify:CR=1 FL=1
MTEKKKRFLSLSVKPLFVLLLGLVLGVCVCLLANFTGEQIIERSYMSDKAVLKRTNRAAQEFQSFVRQNSISTRDTDMLARWGESRKNYYIMLYHDQRQILEIGWWGADSAAVDAYSLKEQTASVVYPIVFRDGTFYAVIYDNSDSGLYDLLWIVSLLLGCAVLALTLWRAGTLEQILHTGQQLNTWLPQTTQQTEPELLGKPVNDKAPQPSTAPLGKPIEDKKQLTEKLSDALDALLHRSADTTEK